MFSFPWTWLNNFMVFFRILDAATITSLHPFRALSTKPIPTRVLKTARQSINNTIRRLRQFSVFFNFVNIQKHLKKKTIWGTNKPPPPKKKNNHLELCWFEVETVQTATSAIAFGPLPFEVFGTRSSDVDSMDSMLQSSLCKEATSALCWFRRDADVDSVCSFFLLSIKDVDTSYPSAMFTAHMIMTQRNHTT